MFMLCIGVQNMSLILIVAKILLKMESISIKMNFLKMYKWKNNIILILAHYFEDNSLYGLAYLLATKL